MAGIVIGIPDRDDGSGGRSVRPNKMSEEKPGREVKDVVYSSDLGDSDGKEIERGAIEEDNDGAMEGGEVPVADEDLGDGEDQSAPRIVRRPYTPSRREVEDHMVSHMPVRAWCPHCAAGKAISGNMCRTVMVLNLG